MEKLREPLIDIAKKIKWIPSFGLEREIDWLKNMQDWLISKKRYWGLALPIYECDNCHNFEVIGSKEELKQKAVKGWEKFSAKGGSASGGEGHSPHRPWIDEVKIKCSKCGETVSRIPDVGNPWLDAGIVPFSTMKYSADKDYWQKWFPADFICESFPGQFKNWFYSLIVMSTVLEKTNPVKTVFGYALVKDEKGEEMHKSKGNAIWFDIAVEKIGADVMRWMYARQNPVYNLNFSYKSAEEIKKKLLILWNSFVFFQTYVDKNELPVKETTPKTDNLLDKWILSRFNNLLEKTTKNLDKYNIFAAGDIIEDFFINDFSLWYIRRSRQRFQNSENENKKREAVETFYFILLSLIKIISPIMPFLAEEMYQSLRRENMPESIHLYDWPKAEKELINPELEEKMEKVREVVNTALAERIKEKIRVRQPLAKLKIKNRASIYGSEGKEEDEVLFAHQKLKVDNELLDLIKEEINVKEVIFDKKIKKEIELDTKITPKLKEEGQIREITRQIQEMRKKSDLKPHHQATVFMFGSPEINKILAKNKDFILKTARLKDILLKEKTNQMFDLEENIKVADENLWLAIKKN
jgi:isoleucyl-tRNA synthetase